MKFKKSKQYVLKKLRSPFVLISVVIVTCLLLVGTISLYKLFIEKQDYVYVKVRMGQGYWWAQTLRPSSWFVDNIKKGDKGYDLAGKPTAEVQSVNYYPLVGSFDIFVTAKLKAKYNSQTKQYSFNRSDINVGAPITINLSSIDITGTVIQISKNPIQEKEKEIIVTLVNQGGYIKDAPYKYDSIKVGDTYFNGEKTTLKILNKYLESNIWTVTSDTGEVFERNIYSTQNIIVKVKLLVQEKKTGLFYGEEQKVQVNASPTFGTNDTFFEGFFIRKIEE